MIPDSEVQHLAKLAKIQLAVGEAEKLRQDFDAILGYVAMIEKVDSSLSERNVETFVVKNVFRSDEQPLAARTYTERMLASAPEVEDGYVVVPKVL